MTLEPDPGHAGGGTGTRANAPRLPCSRQPKRLRARSKEEIHDRPVEEAAPRPRRTRSPPARSPARARSTPARRPPRHPRAVPRGRARSDRARAAGPRSTIRPAPTPNPTRRSTSTSRPAGLRAPWLARRGFAAVAPRAVKPEDNGNMSTEKLVPACPAERPSCRRRAGQLVDAVRVRPRRHHHRGDDLRRPPREPRPREDARGRRGAASPTARASAPPSRTSSRPSSCATRSRAAAPSSRPTSTTRSSSRWPSAATSWSRSTPTSATPPSTSGARRGGREAGLGDPLGRRHGDGPLHRPQHPQHPRLDPAQLAGADRHGADLPGAGEGRRRSGQARLGGVQGHADRAGRAGRRLLHHPRRRAACPTCR